MSDYGDGNFMDVVSPWAPLSSPSVTDNGLNPISDAFLQTNQSEQRSSLVDRVAARVGRPIPPLRLGNMSSFAPFKNPKTVPFAIEISPGQSPSVMLQSPSQLITPYQFPSDEPPETVENSGNDHATTMVFNNAVPYQPMHFDLPPQEGSFAVPYENPAYIPSHQSHVDPIAAPLVDSSESEGADDDELIKLTSSLDDERESQEDEEEYSKDEDEDDDSADGQEVQHPSPKRRKYEVSNMMTTTRKSKVPKVTFRVKTEEDQPYDGYRWRKYGQKIIRGNPNPRGYYKCTHRGCTLKKQLQRAANNVKILVVTYDGMHEHTDPTARSSSSSRSSEVPARLGRPPFSSSTSIAQNMRSFPYPSALATKDMRHPSPYPSALATQNIRPFPYPAALATQDMRRPSPYPTAFATQGMRRPFPYSSASVTQEMRHPYPYPSALATQNIRPFPYPAALATQDMRRPSPYPAALATQGMRRPFPYSSASVTQEMRPFAYPYAMATQDMRRPLSSSMNARVDMTHLYMRGLPSVPVNQNHGLMGPNAEPWVNQNHGFVGQNGEPKTDHVIPDGTEGYKRIMERLLTNYGVQR